MSGICFWYWSTSEQKMTNASRRSSNALCSISCSFEENRLNEEDREIAEILAAGGEHSEEEDWGGERVTWPRMDWAGPA